MKKSFSIFLLFAVTYTLIVWVLFPDLSQENSAFRFFPTYLAYILLLASCIISGADDTNIGVPFVFLILAMATPVAEGFWAVQEQGLSWKEVFNSDSELMFGLNTSRGYLIFSFIVPIASAILGHLKPFSIQSRRKVELQN